MTARNVIERTETMLHPDLVDGRVRLNVYLSNMCDEDLDDALERWLFSEDEVAICNYFGLSSALDDAIDLHQMPQQGNAIDWQARPLFDAMRAELVAMVARIDALTFAEPPKDKP